ncbi:MAG: sulfatase-like hydrolase/transferase [Trueperaceae bacterium]
MTRPKRPPNLLLIITDQQRADTVLPGGPCPTPHLESLAAEGTAFRRAYAPNPICSPTRASLFTGLLPHAHGMTDVTHAVPPQRAELVDGLPFWTRTLRDAGYRTGYVGKWHVERSERLEAFGLDEYETDLRLTGVQSHDGPLDPRIAVRQDGYKEFLLAGVTDEPADATRESYLAGRGVDFVQRAASDPDRPWALVVATEAPHDPYLVPRELYDRIDLDRVPLPESYGDPMTDKPAVYRRIRETWRDLSETEVRQAIACYLAACAGIDDQVGRLLDAVRDTGQEEDTVVVFTSDHGDYLGAHGLFLKGVPAFEEAYRVPLIVRGPGIRPGITVDEPVGLIDLGRTLMRHLLDHEFGGHGRDLGPYLRGERPEGDPVAFAEFHGQRLGYAQRIVWHDRYKYVFNGFAEDELYDLEGDPHERVNLANDPGHAGLLRELAARMWRIVRETGDDTLGDAQYGMFRFAPVGPEAATPDAAHRDAAHQDASRPDGDGTKG